MLQQTQVATAIGYWERWLVAFPTITDLANAPLESVLKQWQGLGYYARARNLHKAAIVIRDTHGGEFPINFEDVLALPGVGRYTAGAVCSIALGQDTPIVDANVIRVLCRLYAIDGDPKSPSVQKILWEKAEALLPLGRSREFNQAMMELGALVCGKSPVCKSCPISSVCLAFEQNSVALYPAFAPKKAFTEHVDVSAVVSNANGEFLLIQRPTDGLWGGLWEFPRVTMREGEEASQAAERAVLETVSGVIVTEGEIIGKVKHGVTTHKITLLGIDAQILPGNLQALGCQTFVWASLEQISGYALSSPQTKLLEQVRNISPQMSLF
jgi:A/G-specific adenine glycosylase